MTEPADSFNELSSEWVALAEAPFFFSAYGAIQSLEEWKEVLSSYVRNTFVPPAPPPPKYWTLGGPEHRFPPVSEVGHQDADLAAVPWTIEVYQSHNFSVEALELSLHYEWLGFDLRSKESSLLYALPDEFLERPEWSRLDREHQVAAKWHRTVAAHLLDQMTFALDWAVETGAAHIMARHNSVLAPFRRVHVDQWHFFQLDKPKSCAERSSWYDPRFDGWFFDLPSLSTATGPAGEKLYAIHIAPGILINEPNKAQGGLDSEQECQRWFAELLKHHAERPPKNVPELIKEACSRFKLSERTVRMILVSSQARTGNRRWSEPGRRPKSSQ